MIARIRTTLIAALLLVAAYVRNYRDRFIERFPVSIDRTVAGLEAIAAKLDRAEAQQLKIVSREAAIQEASYDREDAANAAAERAARVRQKVTALVA